MRIQPNPTAELSPVLQEKLRSGERTLEKACGDFESTVIKQLIESEGTSEFFGNDAGSSLVRHLHSTHLADAVSAGGGIGIAKTLFPTLQQALQQQIAAEAAEEQQS